MTVPCKPWAGTTNPNGYGQWPTRVEGTRLAHRVIFFLEHGYMPEVVRHSCDNPPCVEISHLLAGSYADNTGDAVARGRMAGGERNGRAVLSDQQVAELRLDQGLTHRELAAKYGISRSQVQRLLYGLQRPLQEV